MKKLLLFLTLALTLLPFPSLAAEKSWHISNWQTNIQVNKDSSINVTDVVTFDFVGSFSFVTRTIDHQKFKDLTQYSVIDEKGKEVASNADLTFDSGNNQFTNTIYFSAENEQRTFTFKYTITGALGYFEDHDELYWNILPSNRDVAIDRATVAVKLHKKVSSDKLQHTQYGEGQNLTSLANNNGEFLFTGDSFPKSSNFTIVAGWPIDLIKNPGAYRITSNPSNAKVFLNGTESAYKTPVIFLKGDDLKDGNNTIEIKKFGYKTESFTINPKDNARETINKDLSIAWWFPILIVLAIIFLLHPIVFLIKLIIKWRGSGRDPKGRSTIIAEYDSPDNLPPSMVGVLLDETLQMHEITASLIDLARRGYLTIKELPKKFLGGQDFELIKKKEFQGDQELLEYERLYLEALFEGRNTIKLSELKNKFYKKLPGIQKSVYEEATKRGYFEKNPQTVRNSYIIGGVVVLFVGVFTASFYGLGAPFIIDGILLLLFARFMPKRTPKGVAAKEHALGLKEYIYRAERYRVQKLTPKTFEKFLAFAMVFRIEKEWAKKFKDIYKTPPSWYQSNTPFSANTFVALSLVNSLNSFSTTANSSLASQPGSSGSSGFGGGGFSGGGGGGGGISAG